MAQGLCQKRQAHLVPLAAIPVYILLSELSLLYFILATTVISVVGIFLADYTSKALGVHDHSGIVIDEIAGYLITMIAIPFDWVWMLAGFILFRIFDILKPWPHKLA